MKKKIFILLSIIIVLYSKNSYATSFSSLLPGGKNYLDENNFYIIDERLYLEDQILVKSGTEYTISFPGEGLIEEPYLSIYSDSETYFDGYAYYEDQCSVNMSQTICTFTIHEQDNYLMVEIQGRGLNLYYDHYGILDFQLEEGNLATEYEPYVIPYNDSTSPEFNGSGIFVKSYFDSFTLQDIINNHIIVVDDIDGDITNQIQIIEDNYTGHIHEVGEYLVVLSATDNAGNTATFQLTVIVKDELPPTIDGPSEIDVDINNLVPIESIISTHYNASDGYYDNLAIIAQTDDYTPNKTTIGSYQVILETTDGSSNQITKVITVHVKDNDAPYLQSSNQVNSYLSDVKTIETILSELVILDNYDNRTEIQIQIIRDDYSDQSDSVGTKEVELIMSDSSNNTQYLKIYINVIDDIAPFISGPTSYNYSYTETMTIDDFLSMYTVSDNHDLITIDDAQITVNTFSNRISEIGEFELSFEITDLSGNTSSQTLIITIIDDQAPIIYIDDFIISVSVNATVTEQEILNVLFSNQDLLQQNYQVVVLKNEYKGNEKIPGNYLYSLEFTDESGNNIQKDFVIKVTEDTSLIDQNLLVRNYITYGCIISLTIFVLIKNTKKIKQKKLV